MTDRPGIREVAQRLRDHASSLAEQLLPNGRRIGRQWAVGGIDGEPGQSLRIDIVGDRRGLWCDHASGDGGDMIDLIAEVQCGGDKALALKWAAQWLRLDDGERPPRPARATAVPVSDDPAARQAASWRAKSQWLSGHPIVGTMAEEYLARRGISLRDLGKQPGALRFHPDLHFRGTYYPALLAAVQDGAGAFLTCHRTLLARNALGLVCKADIPEGAKQLFPGAPLKGGCIRLWRGASGRPLSDAPADDRVVICEGIEDGLTIAMADPRLRVLVAVTANNVQHIQLPPQIREVLIAADNDPEVDAKGRRHQARRAIDAAIARFRGEGRRVLITYAGGGAKDYNDRLVGAA